MKTVDDLMERARANYRFGNELTVYDGMQADPDKAGRAIQLAEATGADPTVVLPNIDEFESRTKAQLSAGVVEHDPWLQQYLNSDPMAAKVSNDDWGKLSTFSGVMQRWPTSAVGGTVKGLMNEQEIKDIWDVSREGIKQIIRAPVDVTGIAAPPESVTKEAEDIEKELIRQGQSPEVARKAAEGYIRRAQRGTGILGLIMAGGAALYPQATAAFTLLTGAFRTEVARPMQERFGWPMEATEGGAMALLGLFGGYKMIRGERGTLHDPESELAKIVNAAESYVKAGKDIPVGTHEAIDQAIAEKSKRSMDVFDEAMKVADTSATKERAPRLFKNLGRFHTDADIEIDSDAVRRLYKDKIPSADDKLLGFEPTMADQLADAAYRGGYIKVKAHDFLAYADKDVAKALHDDIKLHPNLMTLNEIKRLTPAGRAVEYTNIYDYIREAAGIKSRPAKQLELDLRPAAERPAYEPSAVGLNARQYAQWMKNIAEEKAGDQAAQLRAAQEELRREKTAEWREKWPAAQAQTEEDISLLSRFQVSNYLREGTIRGVRTDARPKFDPKFIDKELRKGIPKQFLAKGGVNPDTLAGEFGYKSGREMLEDIAKFERDRGESSPKEYYDRVVRDETYRRMEGAYGKPADVALREAQEHVTDDNKLAYLTQNVIRAAMEAGMAPTFTKQQVKDWAVKRFNSLPFNRDALEEWHRASGKNARLGLDAELKGNWAEAFQYYQEQRHAFALALEAKKLNKQIARFDKLTKRYSAKKVENINQEHLDHIQDLMRRAGIATRRDPETLDTELARRQSFRNFYESRISRDLPEGYENYDAEYVPSMSVAEELLEPGWTKRISDMKIGEFKAFNDSLHSIAKDGRDQFKIQVGEETRDLREFRNELFEELRTFKEKPLKEYKEGEYKRTPIRRMAVQLLQLEHIFNRISRRNPDGAFNRLLAPLMDAGNEFSSLIRKFSAKYRDLEKRYATDLAELIPNDVFIDPLSMVRDPTTGNLVAPPGEQKYVRMTRNKLRGVLLNMGTDSNLDKMARGHATTKERIEEWAMNNATREDWEFAESVGNMFKDLQKLTDQVTRSMTDSVVDKIPVRDVATPWGMKRGWYYPMIYDRLKGGRPVRRDLEVNKFHNILARTNQGFERTRTEYAAPLDFNISAMTTHIERRLRDIAFREPVHEVGKIFYDEDFRREMTARMGPHYTALLDQYLRDVAGMSNMMSVNAQIMQNVGEALRVNTVGTLIGWNPSTVMKHGPTALAHSVQEVGVDWYMKAMNDLHKTNPFTRDSNIKFMMEGGKIGDLEWEGSKELQRRHQHWYETMAGAEDIVMGRPTFGQRQRALGAKAVAWSDMVSSRVLWLAKYTEQMERQLTKDPTMRIEDAHKYANRMAERAVRNAHGSTAITAKPELMRRQDFMWRSLTSLYGFWNNTFNRFYRMGTQGIDVSKGIAKGELPSLSEIDDLVGQFMTYIVFPAWVEEQVTPMLNEKHLSGAKLMGMGLLHLVTGSLPVVGSIVHAAISGHDPAMGIFSAAEKPIRDAIRDLSHLGDRHRTGNAIEHLITLSGLARGWGSAQQGRWAKAITNQVILHTERPPRTPAEWYNTFKYGTIKAPGHR